MKIYLTEAQLEYIQRKEKMRLNEAQVLIDNFDKVASLLDFNSSDDFYFVQIIKRYKDNPNDNKDIGNYHAGGWYLGGFRIHNPQELMQLKPQIINMCEKNNARAYMTVNNRSTKETDDYIKIYKGQFRNPNDPRVLHADQIVPAQAKTGPAWKGKRLRLFLDIDTPDKKIWEEVKYILNMCGIQTLAEYTTPSGGLHIILPNKEERNLYYAKKLFAKFDNWEDRGRLATVHANEDGMILLYSNVDTKGY